MERKLSGNVESNFYFYTNRLAAWLVTYNQGSEKKRYREIIYNLLPEALNQQESKKEEFNLVLDKWSRASDPEIQIISKLLKRGIKFARWGWVIILAAGVGLTITGIRAVQVVQQIEQSINPPPVVTIPKSQRANKNASKAIPDIKVSDPDSQNVTVKLKVSRGAIAVKTDVPGGLSADKIANNNTEEVTLSGTITTINKTLTDSNGVVYRSDRSGKDSLTVTVDDGKKSDKKTISITVNDNSVVRSSKFVTSRSGVTITETEALAVIKSWLEAKGQAYGLSRNFRVIRQYTTGEYFTNSSGSFTWLRDSNAYYTYRPPQAAPAGQFFAKGNQVIIDVRSTQDLTLYVNGRIDPSSSGVFTDVYRWTLQLDNGRWKIADRVKLDE